MVSIKQMVAVVGSACFLSQPVAYCQSAALSLPHFLVMKEAVCQFEDERAACENIRYDINNSQSESDEGLYLAGRVRDFVLDFPSSVRFQNPGQSGWTLPYAVASVDQLGLFELAPIAAKRALTLSKLPLVDLGTDGALGLCYTARYYGETGRADLADKIFKNLTANVWPKLATQSLSGTVLFAYADFLKSRGDYAGNETVRLAGQRMQNALNGSGQSFCLAKEILPVRSSIEWRPAYLAYQAIVGKDFLKAKTLIDDLLRNERGKRSHSRADLERLVELAKCYTRLGRSAEAAAVLKQLLPFTASDVSANQNLYVTAELFNSNNASFDDLLKSADKIDGIVRLISLAPRGSEADYGARIVDVFDRLSLAYAYNGEALKAYKIAEALSKKYAPSPERKALVDAHRAYYAALVGRYAEIGPDIEAEISGKESCRIMENVLAKILDVCIKAGKSDVAEKLARHFIGKG
jgi:tetratricopeptide (TPR) repeat protein